MVGVTVIDTIINLSFTWGFSIWGVPFLALGLVAIALSIYLVSECISGDTIFAILGAICLSASLLFFAHGTRLPDTYQYQVLVDDSVSLNEFMDTYNIIEQKGSSYIVEYKEGE